MTTLTVPTREVAMVSSPASHRYEQMYASFYEAIFKHLYRLLGDREQAEDAAQETFLKAWRALPRLREQSNLKSWLFRIATNTAYDQLRRRRIITWIMLDDLDHEPKENVYADPQEWYLVAEPIDALRKALGCLRPLDRAIIAYKGDGFSVPEIATLLRISPGAAKMRLFRARAQLREAFTQPKVPAASGGSRA
jgi:RNA polymerase sigma-70 factor, ECF subfamily